MFNESGTFKRTEPPKVAKGDSILNHFRGPKIMDQIRKIVWKSWSLRRGKKRETWGKPLGSTMRTNNKLNPHMTLSPGSGPW